ncbi:Alpha-ketoglutarate-dependent dioxygenase alkB 6 [Gryllus bimaculatus]|nr:Alpha-ketoglutarate-dependent dioxygenase alkB 6 [Gryllus bimaculatus]
MSLDKFVVKQAPPTVFYISNFISETEEEMIIKNVNSVPKPKWTQLSNRRLQNWGGIPHPKGMVAEKIPLWLQTHMNQIGQLGIFAPGKMPNHVLINEYQPAQGIMDASSTHQEDGFSLFLERRSLVVIQDEVYDNYLHSIAEVSRDILSNKIKNLQLCQSQYENNQELVRGTRISLTIRHVPCTTKVLLRLSK